MTDFNISSLYGEPFTREDAQFALAKADQYTISNEMVLMQTPEGKTVEMSGIDADTMMWQNPDFYGARAWGAAEDTDTANSRITMGMDENMQDVKYNIRWASFQNSVRDVLANYELGDINTMAMFEDIAGETTRAEERVRLGGQEGIYGEQNIPGFSTGKPGMEQNIFQMAGDTISDAASAIGLYDNSLLGVAIRSAGVDRMVAERNENATNPAIMKKLLPEMIRAGKFQFGENDRRVEGAIAGDEEMIKALHAALADARLSLGEQDMGYISTITSLPEANQWFAEARELGLDMNAARSELTGAFLIRRTHDAGMNGAYAFLNGKTPEARAAGLAAVAAASRVFGQDYFVEALAMTHEKGFTPEKGWAALDENRRSILEQNGITFDVFMNGAENDAQAMVRNQASLIMLADREILQIVGHQQRTRLIEREYGEGSWWGSTMRFGGDMYRGMVDDPMAMFDLTIGGPLTGGGGAIRFTASKIAGAGFWRSSGRFMVENAVMEGAMAAGSGFVSSVDAQLGNYQRGRTSVQFDSSLAAEDTAFTGSMGAGFSLALPLGLTGLAKGIKGLGDLGPASVRAGARVGMFGEDAKMRAEAYDIARTLNNDELEFALSHGSLPPEVAVRVQASHQAALDTANTFFQRHVENDGPTEAADSAAAMLDAGELDAQGLSRVEVVNFLMAVATDLGKDGKIGKTELDGLWKSYLVQREKATLRGPVAEAPQPTRRGRVSLEELAEGKRGEPVLGPEPAATVSRAERLQRAMAQRDAEVADNFATSARVTNDPSPAKRRQAENIMARMVRGEDVSAGDVESLLKTMTAVRDGRTIDSFQKFLINNNLKKYMTDDQVGRVVQDLAEMKVEGRLAVEADPTLKRALMLRAVMTNVASDLTTKSASGLGMTTRQIAKFIDAYIATAGNATQRAKLLNDNPAGVDVINKLWDEGSAKNLVVDEANASYDFAAFRRSEAYGKVRDLAARRRRITAAYESARNVHKRSAADMAEAFAEIRKQEEKLRADYKELGVDDYDAAAALDRIEAETKTYENLSPIERRMLMANALTRLVDRVDPELVSTTGASADRHMLKHMFDQTPLGDRIERMFSRVALFPQSQARLFRSNIRLIRAGSQFIGNQHIGRRRYGGRSDLSSIEGVANAAMMETVAVRRLTRDMAAKLGPKMYQRFQAAVQQLRMRGLLVSDTPEARARIGEAVARQMPELLEKYGGKADNLLDDMFALNNQLTDYFQRVFENAKRNGSMESEGIDPRKYVPHNLNSNMSAAQRAQFQEQMAKMKQQEYEKDDAALALSVLVDLGWLERETTKTEVVMDEPNVSVQQVNYTIPENSPFRGISGKSVADDVAYVLKNAGRGRAFLTELQNKILTPEAPKPKKGKKRPKAVGDDPVKPGTKTETTPPIPRSADRGTASVGDATRPVSRTAVEDGAIENALDTIYHTNPKIESVERELAAIAALDRESMSAVEILDALVRYEELTKELEKLVGDAMFEADRMLDEAGSATISLRSDMTSEEISAAIIDKSMYDEISPAHKALRLHYDSYVAQGVVSQQAADLALAMFADIPADKLVGISMRSVDTEMATMGSDVRYGLWVEYDEVKYRLDSGEITEEEAVAALRKIDESYESRPYQGAMIPGGITQDAEGRVLADTSIVLRRLRVDDAFTEANLIAHEVSHALFQNAPRELKLAVQALYARELKAYESGEHTPIREMLKNLGIAERKINYGMTDPHEFMSMLAEVALNRNRSEAFAGLKMSEHQKTGISRIMDDILKAFKKLLHSFTKDNYKILGVARQTEGMSEAKMRALMDTVYSMAHGRDAMVRQARHLDEVFGLDYNRLRYSMTDPETREQLAAEGWRFESEQDELDALAELQARDLVAGRTRDLSRSEILSEGERIALEALQEKMRTEELTPQEERLVRELGDKALAAEQPKTKREADRQARAEAKEEKNDWAAKLLELDEDMQVEILELYSGPLNGNIRDSTMANLIKNKGVHEVTTGGKAGTSTDVLALYRATKDKEMPKDERAKAKAELDRWVKKANLSFAKQQDAIARPTEAGAADIAAREAGRVSARESTERQTPGVWVGAMKKEVDGESVHGTWSGLRNAARAIGDEDLAIAIDRGLAMIELLEEFGDELFEAGLISKTPAPRLTRFVEDTIDTTGKTKEQIAGIRKIYTPAFWVGDKLTGKKSTLETRAILDRIKNRAVQLGFGAGGRLGNFTVSTHVRQPAVVMEEMYGAVQELTSRGVMPMAEEATPPVKPTEATETPMVKAADDANSTGEVGMIAPKSSIDKEGLIKIAEAASDYEEFSRLVRAKYGDDAVDGEHFAIVDEYYDRLNPEVVEAKDALLAIMGINLYHGGTWDGEQAMLAFTHFGSDRAPGEEVMHRIDKDKRRFTERVLRDDANIAEMYDGGGDHSSLYSLMEDTMAGARDLIRYKRSGEDADEFFMKASQLYRKLELMTKKYTARLEADPENADSLMAVRNRLEQQFREEYAELLGEYGVDGFRYFNDTEIGDSPYSFMIVNEKALVRPGEGVTGRAEDSAWDEARNERYADNDDEGEAQRWHFDADMLTAKTPGKDAEQAIDAALDDTKLAETPDDEFFEGSKVVNKDGSPRIVYHGTTRGFDIFRTPADDEKVSTAIYAATRAENAEEYAGGDYGGGGDYFPTGANIRPVYMNIQNPYMLDVEGQNITIGELKAMGYDGIVDAGGGYYAAFSPDQVRPVYARDVPMADKSDAEVVEALEEMPPTEAENAVINMDGEQAKRVAAEAEAKQAEDEALAQTELPVEDSGAAGGKPPKDPPKTAKGADGEGEEPKKKPEKKKQPKKKGRSSQLKDEVLDHILGRKSSTEPTTPSHLNPKYKGNLLDEYNAEVATGRAANERAEQYVQTQSTNMASSRINTSQGTDLDIAVKNSTMRLDNRMSREFSDTDMETPEGAELARLFAENSDIDEMIHNYARGVGTRVKLADVLNELGGVKGYSMADLFAHMEEAGLAILETDAKTGKRNFRKTEAEAKAFRDYMNQLKSLYLKSLGYNVTKFDKNTALNRGLQVAQNLAYSRLGGTFVSSVIFTEGPINLLRSGGLGPVQLLKNGATLLTGIAQIIGGVAARNVPGMSKFMSALGLDAERLRFIGEDIVMAMDGNDQNALAKFGLAETDEAGHAGVYGLKQRVQAHGRRIKSAGGDSIEDDAFLGKLAARADATTAAAADLTGTASGMSQVIGLVKSMAVSVGQNVLARHGNGFLKVAAEMTENMSAKELIALGRKHKVPKQAIIFAAESGLLSNRGATLRILQDDLGFRFGKGGSRGRDIDLSSLQEAVDARRHNRTYVEAGGLGLDDAQARQAELDSQAVGQVQAFLTLFMQQGSPELKGSMRFTAGNPLTSFLFAMTSYPMAAYQHLFANGVSAKGGAAAFGTLSALVALEYNNRLLQQMLYGKDEDTKKEALEKLQRVYSGDLEVEDIVEVLALYGTQSPAFGAWGKYSKDIIGMPVATAAGVDTSGQFRANPFLGPVGGTVSNMYGKALSPLTKMQSDDAAKRERSLSNLISTAVDAGTPFNNALFQTISSNLTGKRVGDLMGEIAVKSDAAGRMGSPTGSAEGFARGRTSRWYSQRRQPNNLADTPDFNQLVQGQLPSMPAPQPVNAPAVTPPPQAPPRAPSTPGEGLADVLEQRKK